MAHNFFIYQMMCYMLSFALSFCQSYFHVSYLLVKLGFLLVIIAWILNVARQKHFLHEKKRICIRKITGYKNAEKWVCYKFKSVNVIANCLLYDGWEQSCQDNLWWTISVLSRLTTHNSRLITHDSSLPSQPCWKSVLCHPLMSQERK